MSDKELLLAAHHIRGVQDAWWYEEPKGVCVVVEPSTLHKQIVIPWASLRGALKRKDKP